MLIINQKLGNLSIQRGNNKKKWRFLELKNSTFEIKDLLDKLNRMNMTKIYWRKIEK
jgi:hypothetical protein